MDLTDLGTKSILVIQDSAGSRLDPLVSRGTGISKEFKNQYGTPNRKEEKFPPTEDLFQPLNMYEAGQSRGNEPVGVRCNLRGGMLSPI